MAASQVLALAYAGPYGSSILDQHLELKSATQHSLLAILALTISREPFFARAPNCSLFLIELNEQQARLEGRLPVG